MSNKLKSPWSDPQSSGSLVSTLAKQEPRTLEAALSKMGWLRTQEGCTKLRFFKGFRKMCIVFCRQALRSPRASPGQSLE